MQPVLLQRERLGKKDIPGAGSICARIAAHAVAAPQSLAVVDENSRLSYAELEGRSNLLAARLRDCGAGPEVCIGLLFDRSVDFVVSALGVLKTGAAYLPLDASTPADRVAFILTDAGSPILLTHRDKARSLPAGSWRIVNIESLDTSAPTEPIQFDPDPSSLAYIVYTSGSMGRPKGVEITHANLCNLIDWHQGAFGVTARRRTDRKCWRPSSSSRSTSWVPTPRRLEAVRT